MSTGSNPHARRRAAGVARAGCGPRRTRVKPARARGPATAVLPRADRPLPSRRRVILSAESSPGTPAVTTFAGLLARYNVVAHPARGLDVLDEVALTVDADRHGRAGKDIGATVGHRHLRSAFPFFDAAGDAHGRGSTAT